MSTRRLRHERYDTLNIFFVSFQTTKKLGFYITWRGEIKEDTILNKEIIFFFSSVFAIIKLLFALS